jgi:hypothetical protein
MELRYDHVVFSDIGLFVATFSAIVYQPTVIFLANLDVIHVVADFAEMHGVCILG